MEFGATDEILSKLDLNLPKDPVFNSKTLSGKPAAVPKVYVGCAKWGRDDWVGKLYPEGIKEKQFLDEYVKHFNSIELNATHYKLYKSDQIRGWSKKADGRDFKFCPKFVKHITHVGKLSEKEEITKLFLERVSSFDNHLGPLLFSVSERFSPKRFEELSAYLKKLPGDYTYFIEIRHEDYFNNVEQYATRLRDDNVGFVITDTAGRRDAVHMYLTIRKAFIRFVGNNLDPTDFTRIDDWAQRLKSWLTEGIEEVYFFIHMHEEGLSPDLAAFTIDKFNETCGLTIPKVNLKVTN